MANYLTPDWLMSDINQLLSRSKEGIKKYGGGDDALSREEFESEYLTGTVNPTPWSVGDKRHYYDYDFGDAGEYYEAGVGGETDYRGIGQRTGSPEGYKFGSKSDAYNAYLASLGYGPEEGYGQATSNIFDREQFVGDIAEAQGIGFEARPPSESFTGFTPQMFKKLRTEYYQPQIESGRQSLIDKLMQKGRLTAAKGGGFAGYGGRERGRRGLEEQYERGVEDIYAGVEEARGKSLQDIYDIAAQYETIGAPTG